MRSETALHRHRHAPRRDARGFTLIELMITLTVLVVVMGTVASLIYLSSRSKVASSNRIESTQSARTAMDMMAEDLRRAGYGADVSYSTPQPPIAYIDSTQVLINANLAWPDTGRVVVPWPLAYDPTGSPRPRPLDGTSWQPPIRYRTGAEVIRYTLDADNNGVINASDQTSPLGVMASRTPNPDDYVLLRQVYGDSTNALLGNNGGTTEEIALVKKPGGTVPPMFTVYLRNLPTPWDWSNGPIPATKLNDIERITVQVDAASGSRDSKGNYAETVLRTDVNSMRNIPNFGATQYTVSGYVRNDNNPANGYPDPTDPGLPNVLVRCGNFSTYTDANGQFVFRLFDGNYTLRHQPPMGFGVATNPDSFVLVVNTSVTRSFADTARAGGMVDVQVYEDLNDNHTFDLGEPLLQGIPLTITPGPNTVVTDASGRASLFAPVGGYSISAALPDTFIVNSTPYPITGTMTNGGSASATLGLIHSATGRIAGKVFRDNNRDGILQSGEPGIQNVWVGVTNNGGSNILGYAYTNASGDYNISVPINDPPHTTPYSVFIVPPPGSFPTTATSINGQWVQDGALLTGRNFGVSSFTVITLNASRVLSLTATDLYEQDWNGNQVQNGHGDTDLILGADAGGTDNISVWFNQYNASPLFSTTPTDPDGYTRLAPNSVLSVVADTLDNDPVWRRRPDVVTGTKITPAGNFFVWLTQNTSGNYGYLPTSYSTGMNYTTTDRGDVQALLTLDCAGGLMPDIIVGTKSPTAGYGSVEVWQNDDAVTPTFTQSEVYPSAGAIPGGKMGEVNTMILADLDNDGRKDLIVGTKISSYSGEVLVFQNVSKVAGARFVCRAVLSCPEDAINALSAIDLDNDGYKDIIAGTQDGVSSGKILSWRSSDVYGSNWVFDPRDKIQADGIVMTFATADFGGTPKPDLAVGWRANAVGYTGGIKIFFTDSGGLPASGTDPSGGAIQYMVPALATGNFNYGTNPTAQPPFLTDLATGVKISATTGALVVFIR